tara:strand:- start:2236 stop:2538 length:303 start_codon:yes stop_codon:yes gene_type:complete
MPTAGKITADKYTKQQTGNILGLQRLRHGGQIQPVSWLAGIAAERAEDMKKWIGCIQGKGNLGFTNSLCGSGDRMINLFGRALSNAVYDHGKHDIIEVKK